MRRYLIEPGDVPAHIAARRMGLSEADFLVALPELLLRGFPSRDETTGLFDLTAIDEWRKARHQRRGPHLALNANDVLAARLPRLAARG